MPDRPNVLVIMTDEERSNLAADPAAATTFSQLQTVLERTRDDVRHTPRHVNPG